MANGSALTRNKGWVSDSLFVQSIFGMIRFDVVVHSAEARQMRVSSPADMRMEFPNSPFPKTMAIRDYPTLILSL